MIRASWCRLRSGAWGVRVEGRQPPAGHRVTVASRSGERRLVQVGRAVWRSPSGGPNVVLYEVVQDDAPETPADVLAALAKCPAEELLRVARMLRAMEAMEPGELSAIGVRLAAAAEVVVARDAAALELARAKLAGEPYTVPKPGEDVSGEASGEEVTP